MMKSEITSIRIGLALGGGGTLGAAYVGVLKAIYKRPTGGAYGNGVRESVSVLRGIESGLNT